MDVEQPGSAVSWAARPMEKLMLYGHDKTIHGTQEVNIERDPDTGEVIAVWFRCAILPFTDCVVSRERVHSMRQDYFPRGILAIEFSDAPTPKEYVLRGIGVHPPEQQLSTQGESEVDNDPED